MMMGIPYVKHGILLLGCVRWTGFFELSYFCIWHSAMKQNILWCAQWQNAMKWRIKRKKGIFFKEKRILCYFPLSSANTNTNLDEVFQIGIQAIDAIYYLALLLHSQLYRMIPLKWEKTAFKWQFIFMYTKNRLQR